MRKGSTVLRAVCVEDQAAVVRYRAGLVVMVAFVLAVVSVVVMMVWPEGPSRPDPVMRPVRSLAGLASVSSEFPIDDEDDVWPRFAGDGRDEAVPFCRSASECDGVAILPARFDGDEVIEAWLQVRIFGDLDTAADWHETAVGGGFVPGREEVGEYDGDFDGRVADQVDFYCFYQAARRMETFPDPVSHGRCAWFVVMTYGQYAVSLFVAAYGDTYFDDFVSGYVRPLDEAMAELVS